MKLFIYLIILFSCASCIALNEVWKGGELIRYSLVKLLLCFVCMEQLMKSITNQIIHYSGCKMNFLFQSIINTPARLLLLSCFSEFADTSCYWCVADFRNWRYPVVTVWQTEGCWRGLGHCMNLHLCISLGVTIWLPTHCPRFFIDLQWIP
jgi:hypothetical protein